MATRLPKLVVIATVGGAFSGLFGVGGGTVRIFPICRLIPDYSGFKPGYVGLRS